MYGRYALRIHFRARHVQCLRQRVHVHIVHQRAVDKFPVLPYPAGVAGNLAPVHEDVVPAGEFRRHSHHAESVSDGLRTHASAYDAVVEVLQVMVDGPAARDPSGEQDAVVLEIFQVHLAEGVLVQADYDRRPVPPKVEDRPGQAVLRQAVLVEGHVEVRVGRRIDEEPHSQKMLTVQ